MYSWRQAGSMREKFFDVRFERIVGRYTDGFEGCRVGAVADVGCAEVRIAGVKRVPGLSGNRA